MTPLIEEQLEAFFREHPTDDSLADIGAGSDECVGQAYVRAHPGPVIVDRYDLDRLDVCVGAPPRRYPVVVSCDLLEHVLDPFAAARNIVRAVEPEGWLYVTTVFAYEHHEYPIDMWRFTTTALDHLFARQPPWTVVPRSCWYEEEEPLDTQWLGAGFGAQSFPAFGARWRVSLVGQRPAR